MIIPCVHGLHLCGTLGRKWPGYLSSACVRQVVAKAEQYGNNGIGATIVRRETRHTGLVLQLVQPFTSLSHLCDVVAHDANSIIDLSLDCCGLWVSASGLVVGGAAAWKIGIIRFRPVIMRSPQMGGGQIVGEGNVLCQTRFSCG